MISSPELEKLIGTDNASTFLKPLNDAFTEFEIDTPLRVASFMAQAMHESARFSRLEENLNYSVQGLLTVFPKYFTADTAPDYARRPAKIAARVYADRMGNGDEASDDGWKFRGRGLFQVTGKGNYRACSMALYGDERLLDNPDLLCSPEEACRAAGWFWKTNKLNQLADQEDQKGITRKINGGYNGLKERLALYNETLRAFGG